MKKKPLVSTLLFVFSALVPTAAAQTLNTSDIDTLIKSQMQRYAIPGVGLALVKDGKVVYTQGYGVRDIKTNTPVNTETLFAIGSVSKSFTSLAIMQQVNAGKINLDTPVQTYLPNLQFSDASIGKKVTVRQLLSMTSGMDRFDSWAFDKTIDTRQKMLETISQIPFNKTPGTYFQYCNQNYVAASAILEQLSKQSWEVYTKTNILTPLSMQRTKLNYLEAVKDGNYAAGHNLSVQGTVAMPAFDRFPIIAPAGSIHSSVNDMAKYLILQMSNGNNVISKKLLTEMQTPQIAIGNAYSDNIAGVTATGYGLGWFSEEYRGVKIIEHGGNINGFSAQVQMLPEQGWGMVILTNRNNANSFLNLVRFSITEQLLNIRRRNDFTNPPALAEKALLEQARTFQAKPEILKAIEGKYALIEDGGTFKLSLEDGKLFGEQGGTRLPILAASDTNYIADFEGNYIFLEFKPSADGLVWMYQDKQVVGVKIPTTTSAAKTLTDAKNRFSTVLPNNVEVVQTTPNFIVAQSEKPAGTFLFNVSEAKTTLEETALGFIKTLDPSFNIKPSQSSKLPAINGVVWTQILYTLPQNQTFAVFATQKGSSVYMVAVQAETKDLPALTPAIEQILSSYKIL